MPRLESKSTTKPDRSRRRRPTVVADAFDQLNSKDLQRVTDVAISDVEAGEERCKSGMMLLPSEVGLCNECCGAIPHHQMLAEIIPGNPPQRVVRGYCSFCKLVHENYFEMRGGVWVPIHAKASILTGPSKHAFLGSLHELLEHYKHVLAC